MFRAKNFCHIASNNRNNVKVGVFVYRTTDDLATVLVSGYFNERIIDINLHDIIIHEKIDATDNTKVEKNVLCVTERTLDNVGTTVIKSKWEGDIEQEIDDLRTYVNNNFVKIDGTSIMTGPLKMRASISFECAIAPYWHGVGFYGLNDDDSVTLLASMERDDGFCPSGTSVHNIGSTYHKWKNLYLGGVAYLSKINNGYDIAVPVTNSADTLALKSQVDDAANSGEQLYTTGVWYAKMYAATVVPSSAEVEGRNYADFSQVDGQGNPIIVVYTYTSGSWATTATITPPATYNGYMTITSKIWDISEQTGQQGGLVLWSHNQKTFTPYPRIVSFEDAALTGTPTAPTLTVSSPNNQIVNKQALDDALVNHGTGRNVGDIFYTKRTDSELNGAVECDGSTYNTTDFTGSESIGDLLEDGKIPYVSMADYATEISTKGWCDSFGWDGTGNTTFKVPTLTAFVWQQLQEAVKGNGITLGITNNDYNFGLQVASGGNGSSNFSTASYGKNVGSGSGGSGFPSAKTLGITTDSTKSGIIVDTTNNVAEHRVMVQLFVSASDEAVATCNSVISDVAELKVDKLDTSADNLTATGLGNLFSYLMPDFTAGVTKAANTTHTADTDGWVWFYQFSANDRWLYIDGVQVHLGAGNGSPQFSGNGVLIPVAKGHTYQGSDSIIFYPIRGV